MPAGKDLTMPIEHVDVWSQYGLPGVFCAALFAFLIYVVKEHRDERETWTDAYTQQTKMMDERQAETNQVIRELVKVISEANARNGR